MRIERFVLDTNTVLSGIVWPNSIPAQALAKALKSEVIVSEEVAMEWKIVIGRPKFDELKPLDERLSELDKFLFRCVLLPVDLVVQACRDPKDDKFLALAKTGNATLIVSGDKDLLVMDVWEGIPILTAREFLESSHGA